MYIYLAFAALGIMVVLVILSIRIIDLVNREECDIYVEDDKQ